MVLRPQHNSRREAGHDLPKLVVVAAVEAAGTAKTLQSTGVWIQTCFMKVRINPVHIVSVYF